MFTRAGCGPTRPRRGRTHTIYARWVTRPRRARLGNVDMTLVVARKRPDSATIVCDTKLTPPNDGRWTLADQANKIVCLESGWSIAYAGHVDYANDAVKRLLSSNPSAFKDIRDPLLAIHKEARGNNCDIDFIILAKPPSLHIHKICDGKCVPCASAAWIGDA